MTEAYDGFPTLGFLAADWIEAHCVVPDGDLVGGEFTLQGWQLLCTVNFYRVVTGSPTIDENGYPIRGRAFTYRRAQVVGPQKTGKGPWSASIALFEAVGPCQFDGWANGGEVYRCEDFGCGCGFEFEYEPGDPMGRPRTTALIQLLATSEDQVDNVYRPMQSMIRRGPLDDVMKAHEGFIRLPNDGRIDPVTAAANSKLGNPINFAVMDETGLYTATNKLIKVAQTMQRGLGGMVGRSLETTNPWDPMENSRAQQTYESRAKDVFKFYRKPPANLSYRNKVDRRKIHEYVYEGSPWVNLDSIEAEAAELLETDPAQAERFFGNKLVQGLGSYLDEDLIDSRTSEPSKEQRICLGFDGSSSSDWTALRAETVDGFRFTPTYKVGDEERPAFWDPSTLPNGRIDRAEVRAAVEQVFKRYDVERMYCDPRDWQTEIDEWALEYGEKVVLQWPTNQITRMFAGLDRYRADMVEGSTTHAEDKVWKIHALNARKIAKPGDKYILGKPAEHQKIDVLMADVLAHEAAADARAEGWANAGNDYVYVM